MFDITEAYNGTMVSAEGPVNGQEHSLEHANNHPATADEILQHAREEAAQILEAAQAEAADFLSQKLDEADIKANHIIAERVNQTFASLGPDLWSARTGITKIVEQSITLMIGAIGSEKAFNLAVNKATQDYIKSTTLTIHAHPDSANRLRLYKISKPQKEFSANYEIMDDTSLEPGRCILDTGEKRIEVSLDIQIQVLKNSLEASLNGGKA